MVRLEAAKAVMQRHTSSSSAAKPTPKPFQNSALFIVKRSSCFEVSHLEMRRERVRYAASAQAYILHRRFFIIAEEAYFYKEEMASLLSPDKSVCSALERTNGH